MRYKATLQRFDDAHVTVAESNERDEVVAAATAVYAALVPTILIRGKSECDEDVTDARKTFGDDSPEHREAAAQRKHGNAMSAELRAREWGIGVYDTRSTDPNELTAPVANLIYWIGATREDSRL